MNAERRKEIQKAAALIEDAKAILETAASDERDYYGNMPESLQSGDKGSKASDAADTLDEAVQSLESAVDNCNSATE